MRGLVNPRHLVSTMIATDEAGVHVEWTLGDHISASPVEFFSYTVEVTGSRGGFLRQYGVKFVGTEDPEVFVYVHDYMGGGNANYPIDRLTIGADTVSIHFNDSGFGDEPADSAVAGSNVNGVDVDIRVPVTNMIGL